MDPKGPKRNPKGPKRNPKGPKRNPNGPKRNPKELKTDFFIYDKSLSLILKKDKYKSRRTQRLIFEHFFYNAKPKINRKLFHTSTLFDIPFFTLYERYKYD